MRKHFFLSLILLLVAAVSASAVDLIIEGAVGPGNGWLTQVRGKDFNRYRVPAKGTYWSGELGLYTGIGLSEKIPLFLETGLGVGIADAAFSKTDAEAYGEMTTLRLPVKVGYRFRLGRRASVSVGVGPYVNWYVGTDGLSIDKPVEVGLTPSVLFRYRKFSVGVKYFNPVIYNGSGNLNRNTFMMTLGLTFNLNPKWGGWKYVGAGVAAAAAVAGSVATGVVSLSDDRRVSSTENVSTRHSFPEKGKKGGYGASDALNSRDATNTYSGYVDLLRYMKSDPGSYDDSRRRNIQSDMKRIRKDNNKNPKNFQIPKSDLEDWDGSY